MNVFFEKVVIKEDNDKKVEALTEMLDDYREQAFRELGSHRRAAENLIENSSDVQSIKGKLQAYGVDLQASVSTIQGALAEQRERLELDSSAIERSYGEVNDKVGKFLSDELSKLSNWFSEEMQFALRDLDNLLQGNYDSLNNSFTRMAANNPAWAGVTFDYSLPEKSETVLSDPKKLSEKYKPDQAEPIFTLLGDVYSCFAAVPLDKKEKEQKGPKLSKVELKKTEVSKFKTLNLWTTLVSNIKVKKRF